MGSYIRRRFVEIGRMVVTMALLLVLIYGRAIGLRRRCAVIGMRNAQP